MITDKHTSLEHEMRFLTNLRDSVTPFNDPWMSSQSDSSLIKIEHFKDYCIDTEALVFMFNGGSPYGFTIHPNHGFLAPWPYLCSTSLSKKKLSPKSITISRGFMRFRPLFGTQQLDYTRLLIGCFCLDETDIIRLYKSHINWFVAEQKYAKYK